MLIKLISLNNFLKNPIFLQMYIYYIDRLLIKIWGFLKMNMKKDVTFKISNMKHLGLT